MLTAKDRNHSDAMDLRRIIPSDITASAIVHVSLLTLLLLFSEVHPFGAATAEQIPVEIVTVQDLAEKQSPPEPAIEESKPEPTPTPQPDFSLLDKPAQASSPQPSPQPSAQPQPAALAQMQSPLAAQRPSQPQPQAAAPAYQQPEPDLSIKYQVLLGLPPDLSPTLPASPPQGGNKGDADFDAPATESADIASSLVAEFRRLLRRSLPYCRVRYAF